MKKEDLIEFLKMLDFERDGDNIIIVENQIDWNSIPKSIQIYINKYFDYLDSIQ